MPSKQCSHTRRKSQCSEDTIQNGTNENHQLQNIALKELLWNVLMFKVFKYTL